MTDEAGNQGLRPVGNPPEHADDRQENREGALPGDVQTDTPGLGPRGEAAQHTPEYSEIQGSRQGGGANEAAVRSGGNPQPADQ